MAGTVFLHVGLPKTGTTYLQSVLWTNREALREQGLLVPGRSMRQHMWATLSVREHPGLANRREEARTAWPRLVAQVNDWPGAAVVSHEFFGAATEEQARAAIAAFGDAEVHLVVTARDALTIVSSYWQEFVKHGFQAELDAFPAEGNDWDEWSSRTTDLVGVLQRWGASLPPERVHLLVLPPPQAPKEQLWLDFARILGIEPEGLPTDRARMNSSLGMVEAELLRRVSPRLTGFTSALDRGVWIRSYLAHGKLVPRSGEKFLPSPERVAALRARADETVAFVRSQEYDVTGDVELLRVRDDLPELRHPQSVTETELLDVAADTIAELLTDVRAFRRENTELKRALAAATAPPPPPPPTRRARMASAVRGLRGSR